MAVRAGYDDDPIGSLHEGHEARLGLRRCRAIVHFDVDAQLLAHGNDLTFDPVMTPHEANARPSAGRHWCFLLHRFVVARTVL